MFQALKGFVGRSDASAPAAASGSATATGDGPGRLSGAPRTLAQSARAAKAAYLSSFTPPREPGSDRVRALVDTLDRDGIAIVPEFLSAARAAALRDACEPDLRRLTEGGEVEGFPVDAYGDYGVYRLHDAHRRYDADDFFASELIREVADCYHTPDLAYNVHMAELRSGIGKSSSADSWHIDEAWIFKLKAFLYLSDVTPETAPFVFMKGSHRDATWREPKEVDLFRWKSEGPGATFGRRGNFLEPREIAYLKQHFGLEELVCSAPAGTLILTDTRGIHKATMPVSGERVMLGIYMRLGAAAAGRA